MKAQSSDEDLWSTVVSKLVVTVTFYALADQQPAPWLMTVEEVVKSAHRMGGVIDGLFKCRSNQLLLNRTVRPRAVRV